MGNRRRTWAATAAGLVAAMALTGCGGDGDEGDEFVDQSVKEIRDAVIEDMNAVESVTLTGQFTTDGGEIALDMAISEAGDCAGTMTIKGGTAEIVSADGETFLKGDDAFWTGLAGPAAEQILSVIGDRWAKMPASDAEDFAELCDLDSFLDEMEDDENIDDAEKGETEEIDGQEALEITGPDEDDKNATDHLWVATEGDHYILKFTSTGGEEPGEFTFTDYNEPVDAEAPAKGDYVELPQ